MKLDEERIYTARKAFRCSGAIARMLRQGYIPVSCADVMDGQIHPDNTISRNYSKYSICTGDLLLKRPGADIKLWRVPENVAEAREVLGSIGQKSKMYNVYQPWSVSIHLNNPELYERLVGPDVLTLDRHLLSSYNDSVLYPGDALKDPVMLFLARTPERLHAFLKDITDGVQMSFIQDFVDGRNEHVGVWTIRRNSYLRRGFRSKLSLFSTTKLTSTYDTRFIGKRQLRALEASVAEAILRGEPFKANGRQYVPVSCNDDDL